MSPTTYDILGKEKLETKKLNKNLKKTGGCQGLAM